MTDREKGNSNSPPRAERQRRCLGLAAPPSTRTVRHAPPALKGLVILAVHWMFVVPRELVPNVIRATCFANKQRGKWESVLCQNCVTYP